MFCKNIYCDLTDFKVNNEMEIEVIVAKFVESRFPLMILILRAHCTSDILVEYQDIIYTNDHLHKMYNYLYILKLEKLESWWDYADNKEDKVYAF